MSIIAQVDGSGTAVATSEKTPMHPFWHPNTVLPAFAAKGTKTSPEIGSTATEWSPGVVLRIWKIESVAASIIASSGPPLLAGLLLAARNQRFVVGSYHT